MHLPLLIVAIMALAISAGCGPSKSPPAPAPPYQPPAVHQPPAEAPAETSQPAPSGDEKKTDDEPDDTSHEEMPAEEKEKIEDDTENVKTTSATPDELAQEVKSGNEVAPDQGSLTSNGRPPGKTDAAIPALDETRPPPSLDEDPFPNGEPADATTQK